MPLIQQILEQHPDAGSWHQQYPWFSIGHLVNTANQKDTAGFKATSQKTAVFFNDVLRMHWLLHQPEEAVVSVSARSQSEAADIVAPSSREVPAAVISTEPTPEDASIETSQPAPETVVPALTIATDTFEAPRFSIDLSAEPDDAEMPEEEEETANAMMTALPNSILSESLAQAADSFKNDTVDEDALVFRTAYQHTIDYFASQGIKLEQEPAHDDQFGRQLKTFTSWLRQMKPLPDATPPEADLVVETYAAHSLQKEDVITESMADVLLKQGKKNQAIALLEKLRLLYPEKSHYFAARIDQLKHS